MKAKVVKIINKTGLHARPASEFVQTANKFKSKITVSRAGEDEETDAKSIIFILSLGLTQGEEIEIKADGTDEEEAVESLASLVESGFGE